MQSLSTKVSADDGWQGELGSERRSLRLHFHTPAYHFIQQHQDDIPLTLQHN